MSSFVIGAALTHYCGCSYEPNCSLLADRVNLCPMEFIDACFQMEKDRWLTNLPTIGLFYIEDENISLLWGWELGIFFVVLAAGGQPEQQEYCQRDKRYNHTGPDQPDGDSQEESPFIQLDRTVMEALYHIGDG